MDILSYMAGLEGLMLLLFLLGIVLVVIEIIMPGFGIAGSLGILSLLAGIVVAAQVVAPMTLTLIIAATFLVIGGLLIWLYNSATRGGRIARTLLLNDKMGKEEGYSSTQDYNEYIGREGVASTNLRPSGIGEFGSLRLDVVAKGEFIQKDSPIKVTAVEGFRIMVEKIQS